MAFIPGTCVGSALALSWVVVHKTGVCVCVCARVYTHKVLHAHFKEGPSRCSEGASPPHLEPEAGVENCPRIARPAGGAWLQGPETASLPELPCAETWVPE